MSSSRPASRRSSPKVANISNPGMNATSNQDTRRSKHAEGLSGITNCHRSARTALSVVVSTLTAVACSASAATSRRRPSRPARCARKWDTETHLGLVRRARRMNRTLAQAFPHVYCELDFTNPLELTVATILSAQSTDKGVNLTTPRCSRSTAPPRTTRSADRDELEEHGPAHRLLPEQGQLADAARPGARRSGSTARCPHTLDELVTLPGVGRKTANVILGNAFDIPGITVDTHFGRLVRRWRWTELEDPVKVEFAIGELIERSEWTLLSHRVIFHGRRVCHAKKPACGVCVLAKDCPSFGIGPDGSAGRRAAGEGARDRAPAGAGRAVAALHADEHVDPLDRRGARRRRRARRGVVARSWATTTRRPGARRVRPRPANTATPTPPRRWPARGRAADLPPCPAAGAGRRPAKRCAASPSSARATASTVDVATGAGRPGRGAEPVGVLVCARAPRSCPRWPSTSDGWAPRSPW